MCHHNVPHKIANRGSPESKSTLILGAWNEPSQSSLTQIGVDTHIIYLSNTERALNALSAFFICRAPEWRWVCVFTRFARINDPIDEPRADHSYINIINLYTRSSISRDCFFLLSLDYFLRQMRACDDSVVTSLVLRSQVPSMDAAKKYRNSFLSARWVYSYYKEARKFSFFCKRD